MEKSVLARILNGDNLQVIGEATVDARENLVAIARVHGAPGEAVSTRSILDGEIQRSGLGRHIGHKRSQLRLPTRHDNFLGLVDKSR